MAKVFVCISLPPKPRSRFTVVVGRAPLLIRTSVTKIRYWLDFRLVIFVSVEARAI
uniref:Uncharacterized protein n=1 Tax=Anguilla anguilla TaxID=7936 RepID=A0A0E9SJV3_ANGAN